MLSIKVAWHFERLQMRYEVEVCNYKHACRVYLLINVER